MRFTPIVLVVALFGCGNSPNGTADGFANSVAEQFMADCKKTTAPNPKAAKELEQLCSCTTNKLRSTVRNGDGDSLVTDKIRQAQEACLQEVYPNG
jgi:hypothetical protein